MTLAKKAADQRRLDHLSFLFHFFPACHLREGIEITSPASHRPIHTRGSFQAESDLPCSPPIVDVNLSGSQGRKWPFRQSTCAALFEVPRSAWQCLWVDRTSCWWAGDRDNSMRIAVIADIHGNLPALEAVLADIERRDVDRTINLGDCVSGPLWPREVCEFLMARDDLTVRGNHDRWVSGRVPTRMGASDAYAFSQLNQNHRSWLEALPTVAHADHGILACHGTPTNDNRYLVEDASEGRLVRAGLATIRQRLGDAHARVALCGHSHQQHFIQLPDGPTILNPGSVGCPSYDDPGNNAHVSEAGSPHARYAVLDIDQNQVSANMIAITYDWKAAVIRAETNNRPDWASGLRTGWFIAETKSLKKAAGTGAVADFKI